MLKYAVIGFGCAGYHAAKAIRFVDASAVIDVYSDHHFPPYNPMLTTYYASDRLPYEGMFPFGNLDTIRAQLDLNILSDVMVRRVDGRRVVTDQGTREYDRVLISTGAYAFVPPVKGLETIPEERVFCMRTLKDSQRLREAVSTGKHRTA